MKFIYINKITKQTYELNGLRDLEHAWKVVSLVAKINGWDEFDIFVKDPQ